MELNHRFWTRRTCCGTKRKRGTRGLYKRRVVVFFRSALGIAILNTFFNLIIITSNVDESLFVFGRGKVNEEAYDIEVWWC